MKRLLFLLCITLLFAACGNKEEVPQIPEKPQAPITVWAYLVAENDLVNVLSDNIEAMYKCLSKMDYKATLLVYWDGGIKNQNLPNPCILKLSTDGYGKINNKIVRDSLYSIHKIAQVAEIVKEYPQQVSTSIDVMQMVMKDMALASPNERIALICGSHADGWLKGTENSRSFGVDGNYTMSIDNMATVMSTIDKTFDLLLFDACLMGNVEVCYNFKDVVNYQIVSPMEIPGIGFPYDIMLDDLFKGNIDGYKEACKEYINFYTQRFVDGEYGWGTISLINSEKMNDLAQAIKQEITLHKNNINKVNVKALQEYGRSVSYKYLSVDLIQFIKELNNGILPDNFNTILNNLILYTGCLEDASPSSHGIEIKNYCGLGMYIPVKERAKWNSYFKTIEWYKAAGWNEVTFDWNF